MGSDLKFTWRALRQAPWYSAAVIGVIALTLALATTVFAIVDGVLFRPLPYPDADRLFVVQPGFRSVPPPAPHAWEWETGRYGTSAVDLASWQAAVPNAMFTAYRVQGWSGTGPGINVDVAGVARVRRNFFDVIGVRPLIGGFSDGDYEPNPAVRPVILMFETWQSRFAGAPDVIGRTINYEPEIGLGLRVVGVMPKGFSFPSVDRPTDFITTFELEPKAAADPKNRGFTEVLARLPEGMSPAMLAERLAPALAATAAGYPLGPKPEGWSENGWRRTGPFDAVELKPLRQFLHRRTGAMFLAVSGAVALLVLIAAANMSSLMSSRCVERTRELNMRRALGAGPGAIARLWAIEAFALVAVGAVLGAVAVPPLLHLILALLPEEVALLKPPRLDARVFGFVAASMVVLAALVAIAPIRRSLRSVPAAKGGSSERVRTAGRFVAVGGQVAAAFVLTVLGACLVGSLLAVYGNSRPITTDGVVVIQGGLRGPGSESAPNRQPRAERIVERLKQTPDVRGVTALAGQFLVGGGWGGAFRSPDRKSYVREAETWAVMPDFFDVIGLRAIEGRLPTDDELRSGWPVVVISQRIAQQYWPDGSGVGQTLVYEPPVRSDYYKQPFTVIGVVAEVPWFAWDMESPLFYVPYKYGQTSTLTVLLRTDGRTGPAIDESLRAIAQADPQVRLNRAAALDTLYRDSISLRRFQSWLFGGFAVAALAVAGVGILGLLAMSTARRTKEIGIRCALGATPTNVRRLLVGEQLAAVVAGLVVGGGVAAWAVGFVKSYVYQLSVADPRIWGAAAALILLTAGLGALLPAVRASRIDPVRALRVD